MLSLSPKATMPTTTTGTWSGTSTLVVSPTLSFAVSAASRSMTISTGPPGVACGARPSVIR